MTPAARHHTIHARHCHWHWDRAIEPVLSIAPGDVVQLALGDPGGGQITRDSRAEDLVALDFARVNPVTGPVHVEGAQPGDAIAVEILSVAPCGWGWSALIPDFGLLAADFPRPVLEAWDYDASGKTPAAFGDVARVPLKPMIGALGLAPAAAGRHDILPPRNVGGTMDIRDLAGGARLLLPVEVAGGLLSCGDGHAAQGDGEVCGTGIETAMTVALRIEVIEDLPLPGPRLSLPGPVTGHLDRAGYDVTTGIGPDLMAGARDAVRAMIDLLTAREGMTPEQAYILCSVAADLRISEIVDAPNWIVSLYFPRIVFE